VLARLIGLFLLAVGFLFVGFLLASFVYQSYRLAEQLMFQQ
jgi:hypothetical protein